MRKMNMEKRAMPDEIRNMLQDLFMKDIHQLESLIDRDLSHWIDA